MFDCKRKLIQWNGKVAKDDDGAELQAGPYLAFLIGTTLALSPGEAPRATYLAIRLYNEAQVELSAEDVVLIRKVLAAAPGLHAWLRGVLQWMLDPAELTGREREAIEALYEPRGGNGVAKTEGAGVSTQAGRGHRPRGNRRSAQQAN